MRESVLDAFADPNFAVSVVWPHMLPPDSEEEAHRAAEMLTDPRVVQFHDPNQIAGREFGRALGWTDDKVAWDVYLFYGRGVVWVNVPPAPEEWAHQLFGDSQADRRRYQTGQRLIQRLREYASQVLRA